MTGRASAPKAVFSKEISIETEGGEPFAGTFTTYADGFIKVTTAYGSRETFGTQGAPGAFVDGEPLARLLLSEIYQEQKRRRRGG